MAFCLQCNDTCAGALQVYSVEKQELERAETVALQYHLQLEAQYRFRCQHLTSKTAFNGVHSLVPGASDRLCRCAAKACNMARTAAPTLLTVT